MKKALQALGEHLSEMDDGDALVIRKCDGKWQVASFSGAMTFVGHGATFEEAWKDEGQGAVEEMKR